MLLDSLKSIAPNLSPTEICKTTGLDYEIKKVPVSYFDGVNHQEIPDKFAVVGKGKVLGVCAKHWEILQNIDIIRTAYEAFGELGLKISQVDTFGGGRYVACIADWERRFNVEEGDIVSAKAALIGSHEVGVGHQIQLYYERLICKNGMTEPVRVARKTYTHSKSSVQSLATGLSLIDTKVMKFQEDSEILTATPINYEEAMMMLIGHFGNPELPFEQQPRIVKSCLSLFAGKGLGSDLISSFHTAWGLLNSLTEYYSHHSKTKDRLNSMFVGSYGSNISRLRNSLLNYSNQAPAVTIPVRLTSLV